MLAQKALHGSETETRELLGGTEENSVSREVIDMPMVIDKKETEKIELVDSRHEQYYWVGYWYWVILGCY